MDETVLRQMPLVSGSEKEMVGVGDWGRQKSTGGSEVWAWRGGNFVVKIPVGEVSRNAEEWAGSMSQGMQDFKSVAPDSMVIVTRVDGENPKPVIVQRQIEGKPACLTSWGQLFQVETLGGLKQIMRKITEVYVKTNKIDVCGQRFKSKVTGGLLQFFPFFSDNIMIDFQGKAHYIDNDPGEVNDVGLGSQLKKASRVVRLVGVEIALETIQMVVRAKNLVDQRLLNRHLRKVGYTR